MPNVYYVKLLSYSQKTLQTMPYNSFIRYDGW